MNPFYVVRYVSGGEFAWFLSGMDARDMVLNDRGTTPIEAVEIATGKVIAAS